MEVIIFKTSVATPRQVNKVQALLAKIPEVRQYNFDTEDCDHIMRIVSVNLKPQLICKLLQTAGFSCEAMESFV